MEWQVGQDEAWVGSNDKWSATIEKGVNYGWYYTLQKKGQETPNVAGNGASVDVCKLQVGRMIEIMETWG